MTEKELEGLVKDTAASFGWMRYHTFDSRRSTPGFPDDVLVHPTTGRLLFRELKTEKGAVTEAQTLWLETLHEAKAPSASVWRPKDWHSGRIVSELRLR